MFQVKNFVGKAGNDDIIVTDEKGPFRVAEDLRDKGFSVSKTYK